MEISLKIVWIFISQNIYSVLKITIQECKQLFSFKENILKIITQEKMVLNRMNYLILNKTCIFCEILKMILY